MGYSTLKAALDAVVRTNGQQQITGANLNGVMTTILQGVDIADRANGTDTTGKSYKILDKSSSFASQVTGTNTIYEIRDNFDLSNGSVTIPSGCVLKFNGGKVSNGSLVGQDTIVDAERVMIFDNIGFSGTWLADVAFSEWLNTNKSDCTKEIGWLFTMAMNGVPVCLEEKTFNVQFSYDQNMEYESYDEENEEFVTTWGYKCQFIGRGKRISIIGNNTIIKETATISSIKYLFALYGCSGEISGITIKNADTYDITQSPAQGLGFVNLFDGCSNLNIKLKGEGVRSCVESGAFHWHNPSLFNSRISVELKNGGYGVALYDGENLDVNIISSNTHRGGYFAVVKSSRITYNGERIGSGTAILLTDGRIIRNDSLFYEMCDMMEISTYFHTYSADESFVNSCQIKTYDEFSSSRKSYRSRFSISAICDCIKQSQQVPVYMNGNNSDDFFDVECIAKISVKEAESNSRVIYVPPTSLFGFNLKLSGEFTGVPTLDLTGGGPYSVTLKDIINKTNDRMDVYVGRTSDSGNSNNRVVLDSPKCKFYIRQKSASSTYNLPVLRVIPTGQIYYFEKAAVSYIERAEAVTGLTGNFVLGVNQKEKVNVYHHSIAAGSSALLRLTNTSGVLSGFQDGARIIIVSDVTGTGTATYNCDTSNVETNMPDNKLTISSEYTSIFEFVVRNDKMVLVNSYNTKFGGSRFDPTLGKPVWWNGTAWVDATGTAV